MLHFQGVGTCECLFGRGMKSRRFQQYLNNVEMAAAQTKMELSKHKYEVNTLVLSRVYTNRHKMARNMLGVCVRPYLC